MVIFDHFGNDLRLLALGFVTEKHNFDLLDEREIGNAAEKPTRNAVYTSDLLAT